MNTPRTAERLRIKENLRQIGDSVSFHKDGTISVKRGYFYRNGYDISKMKGAVTKMFPNAAIIRAEDRWAPWPRDSYFIVCFKLEDQSKIDAELDLELAVTDNQE